ncbi:MAG: SGNH/GDSL hydrolase family protein [Acetobacterium woodii]|nr:SGNH/GDSL hydrolase family protein [Acetobacterium woodii]
MDNEHKNDVKMCVFGDSIGKGILQQNDSDRYGLFKIDLNDLVEHKRIILDNFSKMGSTVAKGLSIVKRHSSKLSNYDSVFLEFGGNDCSYAWNEIAEDPKREHIPKTPAITFEKTYTEIIDEIKLNDGNPIMLSLPPLVPERYFEWFSKSLNRENILKWVGSIDVIYRWQEMYNLKVVLLAKKLSIPLIDIRSAFLNKRQYKDFLCKDGIHPNDSGYELIYNTIMKAMQERNMQKDGVVFGK